MCAGVAVRRHRGAAWPALGTPGSTCTRADAARPCRRHDCSARSDPQCRRAGEQDRLPCGSWRAGQSVTLSTLAARDARSSARASRALRCCDQRDRAPVAPSQPSRQEALQRGKTDCIASTDGSGHSKSDPIRKGVDRNASEHRECRREGDRRHPREDKHRHTGGNDAQKSRPRNAQAETSVREEPEPRRGTGLRDPVRTCGVPDDAGARRRTFRK